jgi:uncharacterized phage protein (TIGR01671 family)
MNRKIKFRGYSESQKKWIFGWLVENKEGDVFIRDCETYETFIVVPESVGQFTGLQDKTGRDIYDVDILGGYPHGTVCVKWNKEFACFESISYQNEFDEAGNPQTEEISSLLANDLKDCFDAWSVIGNIYENPELLTN